MPPHFNTHAERPRQDVARTRARRKAVRTGVSEADSRTSSLVPGPPAPDVAPLSLGSVGVPAEDLAPSTPLGGIRRARASLSCERYGLYFSTREHLTVRDRVGLCRVSCRVHRRITGPPFGGWRLAGQPHQRRHGHGSSRRGPTRCRSSRSAAPAPGRRGFCEPPAPEISRAPEPRADSRNVPADDDLSDRAS